MDFDSLVDDSTAQTQSPPPQQGGGGAPLKFDDLQDDHEKYGSQKEQIKAAAEGLGQGIFGPLATAYETKVLGIKPEDIAGRAEANPWSHGAAEATGLGVGMLTGVGEAGLIAAGAEHLVPGALSVAGKIGSGVLKGAIEAGAFQGGDEITKSMLGQGDPETPVASALGHMGAAALLGGGIGGLFAASGSGLKALAEAKAGASAAQWVEDFGNRWKFNQENPDLTTAITNEIKDFHSSTMAGHDEVYGMNGLKDQAIRKLVPEMNEAITQQNEQIAQRLQSKITEMIGDSESYPARLTKKLSSDANQWMETATNPNASSYEVFNATQELKQKLQAYSKFDKMIGPLSPEKDFINLTKSLQSDLVSKLEDTRVWGKAGELQKGVNKSFSNFLDPLKDFNRRFTQKLETEGNIVDPDKIKTFVNQVGKGKGAIRKTAAGNFIDAAQKYREEIANLHHSIGLESPIAPASLNSIKGLLGESTAGAQDADHLFHVGLPGLTDKIASASGAAVGAGEGYREGGVKGAIAGGVTGLFLPKIGQAVIHNTTHKTVPLIIKALSSGRAQGIIQYLDYAAQAQSGAMKINKGVEALFKGGGQQAIDAYASDRDREKLRSYIESGQQNEEIQKGLQAPAQAPPGPPAFAHGGEVKQPLDAPAPKQLGPNLNAANALETHNPDQNMLLQSAKGRINNYLNSVRPMPDSKLPFDAATKDPQKERQYNKVLDMANQPLSVLNHIKDGSLTPEQVKHFSNMYPELYNHLSKKLTERVTKAQMDKETPPPAKTRQAMSLFLGSPLDSSMSPGNIMAAQSVFAKAKAVQQQAPDKPKKNTSTLTKMSQNYDTQSQSREQRQQKV